MKYQFGPKVAKQTSAYAKIAELNDGEVDDEDAPPQVCKSMMTANQRSVKPVLGNMSMRSVGMGSDQSVQAKMKKGQATLNIIRQLSLQFTGEKFIGIDWGATSQSQKAKLENDLTIVHRSLVSHCSLVPSVAKTTALHELRLSVGESLTQADNKSRGGYLYAETLKLIEAAIKDDKKVSKERSIRSLDFFAVEGTLKNKLENKSSYIDQLSRTVEVGLTY